MAASTALGAWSIAPSRASSASRFAVCDPSPTLPRLLPDLLRPERHLGREHRLVLRSALVPGHAPLRPLGRLPPPLQVHPARVAPHVGVDGEREHPLRVLDALPSVRDVLPALPLRRGPVNREPRARSAPTRLLENLRRLSGTCHPTRPCSLRSHHHHASRRSPRPTRPPRRTSASTRGATRADPSPRAAGAESPPTRSAGSASARPPHTAGRVPSARRG